MNTVNFFDPNLLNKYATNGPRYTSYPTALAFNEDVNNHDFLRAAGSSTRTNLSVYVHIPFCHRLCYYCGCNKIVTRHTEKADQYLDYLLNEISLRAPVFRSKKVGQLHLGGGTPSYLTKRQLERLIRGLQQHFTFATDIEMSIEVDPREIELEYADQLASLGFNRLSIGVQDTNKVVQKAINRLQSTSFVKAFISRAKQVGFSSVNIDLIYGLPHQTIESFADTLQQVTSELDADRISLFSYAHMPSLFAAQRKIPDQWLPDTKQKLALMQLAIQLLCQHGYEFIGMDHFAKPEDELAQAQRSGNLHRNFQGYTTRRNHDLLGLGVSAISSVGNMYAQNSKELKEYYQLLDTAGHAIKKGNILSYDDQVRGTVIRELMCNLCIDKSYIESTFNLNFDQYFQFDLQSLRSFVNDGLVSISSDAIVISPKARLLVRNICMSFDAYMHKELNQHRFSRVI